MIYYCFNYTKKDIEEDFNKNGGSTILEKITKEKNIGGCNCEVKNPEGKLCLGDVHQVVETIKNKRNK